MLRNRLTEQHRRAVERGRGHALEVADDEYSADRLRELRPRGRSPVRAFYRQIGDVFVVAAVGSEAQVKPREFARAVSAAEQRLKELEKDDR